MGGERHFGTMFVALVMLSVLIGTTGLGACTCQDDCQDDRSTCESGCDSTYSSCLSTCDSTQQNCETGCDNTYNSCMSSCGGDPDCEMQCGDERMMCQMDCGMNGEQCRGQCDDARNGCYGGCGNTYDACIAACPPPPSITHTKGRYWVNHTWVLNCTDESVPTSYNVSINQTWHNGTATRWYNNSGLQGGVWSNAIVMAWNATSGTICSVTLSENVYLPLPVPPAPVGTGSTWDFFWVNHTWSAGSDGEWAGDTDSFNVSIETHWINGTTKNEWNNGSLTTFYNNSLDGEYGWSNITVWSYNATGGLSSTYIYQNVEVPIFIPPTPVNPQSTSGRFWVNHSWSPGTGHYTDSYNVSLESGGWHNGTPNAYYKEQMSANGWSNITVYAYNSTHHELSESALTDNVLVSWTDDIFVNTSGWWRDGDVFNATATPFSCAVDNVTTGDSIRVYDGTYYEAAILFAGRNDITITPVSGQPVIYPSKQQGTLTISGDNISISGFLFRTSQQWVISDGYALAFYGSEDSTASNNDFIIRQTSHGDVVAISVWNSDNCTISGGEIRVEEEGCIDIDWMSSRTTVTGTYIHAYFGSPQYGIRIERRDISPYYQHNTISGNTIYNTGVGIAINASSGGVFDDTNVWVGNSVSGCAYGVKHISSAITWTGGSTSSNTHDHYFTGDTSGSVIQNPSSLANLYLADAESECTVTHTGGRMFDVCGARHEYIDDLAYAHPNGTFSRHIRDSSPLLALTLRFYDDFTITPSSAPVSVANIEFFGSACDATGGHDVEVDVASSTPANEVRFNITGDSTWINDYVDMNISGTFVKREKANVTGFVSILYTGGFSSHHFEFDEIYIPAGEGGVNPFLNPSFECQRENGGSQYETTFCNWSQTGLCSGNAPACELWWTECGAIYDTGSGVCRTGSWHTDGDYSAWITSNIRGYEPEGGLWYPVNCVMTTKVYQSVDLTGIDTLQFDARLRHRWDFEVVDGERPGRADVLVLKYIAVYVDGTRVWWGYDSWYLFGHYEGYHSGDNTVVFLEQEADVSAYSGDQTVELVSHIEFYPYQEQEFSTIDGWMQMQAFFDNINVLYSVQPPENLLHEACPYWVNHTWDVPTGGAVIDSYNVSVNSVWHNGTTDPFYKDDSLTDWRQWSNISVYSYNATEGLSPANSSAAVQLTPAIPDPTDLTHTEGHIWIRHAWAPGSSFSCRCVPTQSYNISVNDVWYNGTTDTFYNDAGLAYEDWSNITVYAWNSDTGLISNNPVTQNLKVDSPKPSTPVGGTGSWGFFWVNHSWSAGSDPETSCTDSYNYSITTHPLGGSPSTIWYNDSTNTSHNNTLGTHGWSNITVYAWNDNATAGLSENAIYQDIEVPKYTPPDPTYIHNETDPNARVWANFSWACDEGGLGLADSFNISINEVWHNGTTLCNNNQPVPEDSDFEDNTLMGWNTSGSYAWTPTAYGYESTYAIRDGFTGTATGSSTAWKNITLDDYGSMYFDCKLNDGTLTAYNGSETLYEITGTHDWQSIRINLTAGTRTIKFTYQRPTSPTPENHAWIDNIAVRQRVHGWYLASGIVDDDIDIVVWAWNDTHGGISESYADDSVYIEHIPRPPCNINHTTGWYWVNHTWEPGGYYEDSYNVSINSVWHNDTTNTFHNDTTPTTWGQWSNITVWAWNTTHATISLERILNNVTIPTPELIDWFNNATNDTGTTFEVLINTTVYFNCTSETTIPTWIWTGEDTSFDTTNSITTSAEKIFDTGGIHIITVVGSNAYGVTETKRWIVQVYDPQMWHYPAYHYRKPVAISNPCGAHTDFFIPVHIDTTDCVWSDCRDLLFYDPIARTELPFYTYNDMGDVEISGNELVYVQVPHTLPGGDFIIYAYLCNPNETSIHYAGTGRLEYKYSFGDDDFYFFKGYTSYERYHDWVCTLIGPCSDAVRHCWNNRCNDGSYVTVASTPALYMSGIFPYWGCRGGADAKWYMNHEFLYEPTSVGVEADWLLLSTGSCWSGSIGIGFCLADHVGDDSYTLCQKVFHFNPDGVWNEGWTSCTPPAGAYNPAVGYMYARGHGLWCHQYAYIRSFNITQKKRCIPSADAGVSTHRPDPGILFVDAKGNQLTNVVVSIDDLGTDEPIIWQQDADGVIYFTDGITHSTNIAVRTHEGVFTKEIHILADEIAVFEVPITYNLNIRAFDEGGRQLDETICTLSEYTVRDPGFFWGLAMGNRTSVRMRDISAFGMCDMTVEKAGYGPYNETELNWTTQSTMISDYKHDVTLETE